TVLWHHCLGHSSVQRLCGIHSMYLVSGLPRVLPRLPHSPAPPCLPCVEGRQRAAPHSSSFPPTEAPLQTLHLDVWGPACVRGQGHERYFLLVIDDYTRYTTVFPLRNQGGGEFSSNLLAAYCAEHGIRQTFTLPGLSAVEWVQYAAQQLNLWPRVSVPETSPTLRWTGEVGNASVFRVWGCRAFVHDTSADKLSSRAVPCVPSEDPLPPQGAAPSGVSQVDPVEPVEVAVDSGPARGAERAEPGGAGSGGTETGGAEPGGCRD
ncbi:unnamed protein product, partial [Closterium sp. NIES-65]